MDKKFYTFLLKPSSIRTWATFEEAEKEAKRYLSTNGYSEMFVVEALAVVKQPVPEAEVVKLT